MRQNVHDSRNPFRHVKTVSLEITENWEEHLPAYVEDHDVADDDQTRERLARVDVDQLSPEALDALFAYAVPLAEGQDIEELAELHGITDRTIRSRLSKLHNEDALGGSA
jgi:DNA-directed RNA polymerase specialized sigma24 family protein